MFADMASKRYMCKSPFHLLYLDALVDVFPDATLIYTYRPLTEALASNLSLHKILMACTGFKHDTKEFFDRYDSRKKYAAADPEFPRATRTPKGVRQPIIWLKFPENCMKINKLDWDGGIQSLTM